MKMKSFLIVRVSLFHFTAVAAFRNCVHRQHEHHSTHQLSWALSTADLLLNKAKAKFCGLHPSKVFLCLCAATFLNALPRWLFLIPKLSVLTSPPEDPCICSAQGALLDDPATNAPSERALPSREEAAALGAQQRDHTGLKRGGAGGEARCLRWRSRSHASPYEAKPAAPFRALYPGTPF